MGKGAYQLHHPKAAGCQPQAQNHKRTSKSMHNNTLRFTARCLGQKLHALLQQLAGLRMLYNKMAAAIAGTLIVGHGHCSESACTVPSAACRTACFMPISLIDITSVQKLQCII
jgi:hypothetical protein